MNSEKDNKIANNIGNNSAADFDGKNNLSYSYKVPDQLEVSIFVFSSYLKELDTIGSTFN